MGTEIAGAEDPLPAFDKLWNYQDPAGTQVKFREILQRTEAAPRAYVAELLTQIARCDGLQGKYDSAHAVLDRVEGMLKPEMKRARVRYLLERGRAFNSNGDAAKALLLFQEAWEIGRSSDDLRLATDAIHMIAIAQSTPAQQVVWNLKGIDFVQQNSSERGWLYSFYNNLGEAYAAQADYENALKSFHDMADLDLKQGREPELYTNKDIAKMLRKLGRIDEATTLIQPLHEALESKGQPDGWIDEEYAECLLAAGKDTQARPLFARAYEAQKHSAWVQQHEPAKLERLKQLACK